MGPGHLRVVFFQGLKSGDEEGGERVKLPDLVKQTGKRRSETDKINQLYHGTFRA